MRRPYVYLAAVLVPLAVGLLLADNPKRPALSVTTNTSDDAVTISWVGVGGPYGMLVLDVAAGSPADQAGVRRGDFLFRVNDVLLDTSLRSREVIGDAPPGTEFELHFLRYDDISGTWQSKTVKARSVPFELPSTWRRHE